MVTIINMRFQSGRSLFRFRHQKIMVWFKVNMLVMSVKFLCKFGGMGLCFQNNRLLDKWAFFRTVWVWKQWAPGIMAMAQFKYVPEINFRPTFTYWQTWWWWWLLAAILLACYEWLLIRAATMDYLLSRVILWPINVKKQWKVHNTIWTWSS